MFVTITELAKRYDSITAVDNVSFELTEGSLTTLLGPSGCGKTTTLRCIAGLETPDKGEVTMEGQKLFSKKDNKNVPPDKRKMGMVFQSYAIWPHMTVFGNIAFPLKVRKLPSNEIKERVQKALGLVKLPGLEKRPATQLSGGQQQRVALARSLVMEPKLLLLDEPLSNLDAKLREEMRLELRDLQKSLNITTLYVTHDQAEAFTLSDEIKIIFDGRIIAEGSPEHLYCSPGTEDVASFLGHVNMMPAKLKAFRYKGSFDCVETPMGEILCKVPRTIKEGETFRLYLRPSYVTIYRKKPRNRVNVFKGKIDRATYIGSDYVEYHIVVNDQVLRIRGQTLSEADRSNEIFLGIDPESGVCIRS